MMNLKELCILGIFKINSKDKGVNFTKEEVITALNIKDQYYIKASTGLFVLDFNTVKKMKRILCCTIENIVTQKTTTIFCTENELRTYIPKLVQDYLFYLYDNRKFSEISDLIYEIDASDLFSFEADLNAQKVIFKVSAK